MSANGKMDLVMVTGIAAAMLFGSVTFLKDVHRTKQAKDFRERSFLLDENHESYLLTSIPHYSDCIISNKEQHFLFGVDYSRFENSCEFIWAEAETINRKFNQSESKMTGVLVAESQRMFRYLPMYKEDNKELSVIGGKPISFDEMTISRYEIRQFNQEIINGGLY